MTIGLRKTWELLKSSQIPKTLKTQVNVLYLVL